MSEGWVVRRGGGGRERVCGQKVRGAIFVGEGGNVLWGCLVGWGSEEIILEVVGAPQG